MPRIRAFTGPDETTWGVEVQNPGASNAVVLFRHPDGQTGRLDRYAWYITRGAESQNVTGRLNKRAVLDSLGGETSNDCSGARCPYRRIAALQRTSVDHPA
jgi:hypothetical protein